MQRTRALLLWLSALAAPLRAQTFTPQSITFAGAPAYASADLLRTTGLTPGRPIGKAEVEQAMQNLNDTGLFAGLRYDTTATTLAFDLTPQPDQVMLPVLYTNFVVLDPTRITALVHDRVPLFTGKVPNSGSLLQQVQDALTAILRDKGIKASISSVIGRNGDSLSLALSIVDPPVQIRRLTVTPVAPAAVSRVVEVVTAFESADFDLDSDAAIRQRLLQTYRDLGFLDVSVDPVAIGPPMIDPAHIQVDVNATVHDGGVFHLTQFTWPSTPAVPPADFAKAAEIKPGEPASRILVLTTTANVQRVFENKGYFAVKLTTAPHKDSATHTIGYTYDAEPGVQFTVGIVHTPGFSPEQLHDFDKVWKLQPGAPYDDDAIQNSVNRLHSANFQGYGIRYSPKPNPTAHTVDITFNLVKR